MSALLRILYLMRTMQLKFVSSFAVGLIEVIDVIDVIDVMDS